VHKAGGRKEKREIREEEWQDALEREEAQKW